MAVGGGGGRSSKVVVSSGDFSNSARGAVSSGSGDTELGRESMATHGLELETHKKPHEITATAVVDDNRAKVGADPLTRTFVRADDAALTDQLSRWQRNWTERTNHSSAFSIVVGDQWKHLETTQQCVPLIVVTHTHTHTQPHTL